MRDTLETAAAAAQEAFEAALPGVKVFGPIAARDGRVEVSLAVEASGAPGRPLGLMADELKSAGSREEAKALAAEVAGAANVSGKMFGKFVYLRQFDVLRGADYAAVALHLEPVQA